jgi:MinD-like ATPase involved in chromosome partitioning or flagellar assembly
VTGPREESPRVLSLVGGKGGVGTSLVAANLAIHLARQGRQVVLLDLADSGPSAHAHIGFPFPGRHLGKLLPEPMPATGKSTGRRRAKRPALEDLMVSGGIPNLKLIAGVPDQPAPRVREDDFGASILLEARKLPCDVVVADLGSSRTRATSLSCRAATTLLMVTTPEPQALRGLLSLHAAALQGLVEHAVGKEDPTELTGIFADHGLRGVMESTRRRSRLYHRLVEGLESRRFGLILNQVRSQSEVEAATRLGAVLSMLQAVVVDPVISLEYDMAAVKAGCEGKVLSQSYPNTAIAHGLERLIATLNRPDHGQRTSSSERYAPVASWHHYRLLALDPRSSPREIQQHYEWILAPFRPGGEAETVARREHLDTIVGRLEAAYRALLFLESRQEYDQQLVRSGVFERSALRSPEEEEEMVAAGEAQPGATPALAPTAAVTEKADGMAVAADTDGLATDDTAMETDARVDDQDMPPEESTGPQLYDGPTLKRLRQRRRLDVARIEEITKIRAPQIVALEESDYPSLPPSVFLRGFLRAYAICLDLDPDKVVNDYMDGYDAWRRMRV